MGEAGGLHLPISTSEPVEYAIWPMFAWSAEAVICPFFSSVCGTRYLAAVRKGCW